jgi:hypothetical protein
MRDSVESLHTREGSLLMCEGCDKAIINITRSATRVTNNENLARRYGFKIVAAGSRVPRHLTGRERWCTV